MTWPFVGLLPLSFPVILADPPWRFMLYSDKGENKSPQSHYETMDLASIKALPVNQMAAIPDAILFMWATAPMLPQALEVMAAWGFKYCTMGVWAKRTSTGNAWAFGTGYRRRSAAEPYLIGTIGKPKLKVRNVRNLIVAPVRQHSRKPDQMRTEIEAEYDGPYLELFAREPAPGWTSWGNETGKFAE